MRFVAVLLIIGGCGQEPAPPEPDVDRQIEIGLAKTGCRLVVSEAEMFKREHGRYPATLEEMAGSSDWIPSESPAGPKKDPWGNPLLYRLVDGTPRATSMGPDGKLGTDDDIVHP